MINLLGILLLNYIWMFMEMCFVMNKLKVKNKRTMFIFPENSLINFMIIKITNIFTKLFDCIR